MKKVQKVWGHEEWIVNSDYCGKKLVLKKNHHCSFHHHKIKDETFYVINGRVLIEIGNKKHVLKKGESIHIKPNENHRFYGIEDSEIIEFSSHHEESDSHRQTLSGKINVNQTKRLKRLLENFHKKKVMVIGDIMLDKYVFGDVNKISPEAPIQILNVKKELYVPGAAANSAANINAMDGEAFLIGVIGNDLSGKILERELKKRKISNSGIVKDKKRPTTLKVRLIGHNQQLVRMDYENNEHVSTDIEKRIIDKIKRIIDKVHIIIISDYAKGIITKNLMLNLIKLSKEKNKFIIVDPKPRNIDFYKGVDLVTPNKKEAKDITGLKDLNLMGKSLINYFNSNVLIKRGEDGMSLFELNNNVVHLPAKAKEVYDVSGAGDTSVAAIAMAVASGAKLSDAIFLGNNAGAIKVGKLGTATVSLDELKRSLIYF